MEMSPYLERPLRSMPEVLADMLAEIVALPTDAPRAAALRHWIATLETEIEIQRQRRLPSERRGLV